MTRAARNTPIPAGLKLLHGSRPGCDSGGRRVPLPPVLERGLPDPPEWLPDDVRAVWKWLAPQVDELGVAKPQDGTIFEVFCECLATYRTALADVQRNGQVQINPKTGMAHKNPALGVAETAGRDLLRYARELALTPMAESVLAKLPVDDDADTLDPFA